MDVVAAAGGAWVRPGDRPAAGAYVLAGWWRRAGAWLVDAAVVGSVGIVIRHAMFGHHLSTAKATVSLLISAAITLAYFAPLMIATNGRTFGKLMTGIRVIRTDLQPMNFGRVFRREAMLKGLLPGLLIDAFVFVGGSAGFSLLGGVVVMIDYLWPLWDAEHRAVHDWLAKTRVVLVGRD
jgi:uncharacterized RDD family membrane protein YckC